MNTNNPLQSRSARSALAGLALFVSACAHAPTNSGVGPKLVVLPIESESFPQVAEELNAAIREAQPAGVREVFTSKVSLEVAQLSVECVEPSSTCYSAVGKAMGAGRMLVARIEPSHEADRTLRVRLILFDVEGGRPLKTVDRGYRSVAEATRRIRKQLAQALETAGAPSEVPPQGDAK